MIKVITFTRPLTNAELAACNFKSQTFMTDTRTLRFYYRLLNGKRLQIGSRSVQNFPLLREVGASGKPVLLTLFLNWCIKPFTMYAICVFFFYQCKNLLNSQALSKIVV